MCIRDSHHTKAYQKIARDAVRYDIFFLSVVGKILKLQGGRLAEHFWIIGSGRHDLDVSFLSKNIYLFKFIFNCFQAELCRLIRLYIGMRDLFLKKIRGLIAQAASRHDRAQRNLLVRKGLRPFPGKYHFYEPVTFNHGPESLV